MRKTTSIYVGGLFHRHVAGVPVDQKEVYCKNNASDGEIMMHNRRNARKEIVSLATEFTRRQRGDIYPKATRKTHHIIKRSRFDTVHVLGTAAQES